MKRSKKVKDLTGSAGYKQGPGVEPAEKGKAFLGTRQTSGRKGQTLFRDVNRKYAAEKRRKEEEFKRRTLPIEMKSLVRRLGNTPFGKWTAKDMQVAEELLNPEIVHLLSEKAKKLE